MSDSPIIALSNCPVAAHPELARLIHSVLPEYYELLCPSDAEAYALIARHLTILSEVNNGFAIVDGETPQGVVCCYPIAEREIRQTTALLRTVASVRREAVMVELRKYAQTIAPIPETGLYVSRLVVAFGFRERGFGRRLMAAVEQVAHSNGHDRVTLHVHRTNHTARAFYESCGLQLLPPRQETYHGMQKILF